MDFTSLARKARVRSKTGVYHVVIQSASHKEFFRDEEDYRQFLLTLDMKTRTDTEDEKDVPSCVLYAYCLLPTHVHLLIKEDLEDISMILKRIGSSYVHYFNRKYGVDGTLFKGRFKSEPVEDDGQLRELLRFIHQNPRRHGIAGAWRYGFVDSGKVGMKDLERWLEEPLEGDARFIEATEPQEPKPSDVQVWMLIVKMVGVSNRMDFLRLPDVTQRDVLMNLRQQGASVRQLERLTGIGRGIIQCLK